MVNGKVASLEMEVWRQRRSYEARDVLTGQRMQKTMQATWSEVNQLEIVTERSTLHGSSTGENVPNRIEAVSDRPTSIR